MPEETSEVFSQMKMQLAKVLDRKQHVCFGTFLVLFLLSLCYVSPNPQITVVFKLVPESLITAVLTGSTSAQSPFMLQAAV